MDYESQYLSSFQKGFEHKKVVEENWTWIILLGLLILMFIGFGIWIWSIKPPPPNIAFPRTEKSYDSSLKTPTVSLILADFTKNSKDTYPWCIPTWYAIRYVNKQGGYSKLGPWTKYPIVSGGTNFPGGIDFGNTCDLNLPILGTKENLDYDVEDNNIVANVHWQVKTFDPKSEGHPIGQLTSNITHGLKYRLTNGFSGHTMLGQNQNKGILITCTGCKPTG